MNQKYTMNDFIQWLWWTDCGMWVASSISAILIASVIYGILAALDAIFFPGVVAQ